jgi:recombinational DNA repair protein RecT
VAALKGEDHDRQFVVLSKAQVEARRARGTKNSPAWQHDYLAMAKKTAVRALFTWLPKSPEMAQATVVHDAEETGARPAEMLDAQVVEQLTSMALAPAADATAPFDNSTGEVRPEDEGHDEDMERGR